MLKDAEHFFFDRMVEFTLDLNHDKAIFMMNMMMITSQKASKYVNGQIHRELTTYIPLIPAMQKGCTIY